MPLAYLIRDFRYRLLRDGRTETAEELSFTIDGCPRSKRIPEKVKFLVRVVPLSIRILAVDNLCLLRMQLQSALLAPMTSSCIAERSGKPN